jgi:hypothetical protein
MPRELYRIPGVSSGMRSLVIVAVVLGCGGPPPPKPPPKELSADRAADLAGKWVTDDEMDWGYTMTITPDGVIDVWIDRGKMGRCEQKGTMTPVGNRTFRVIYTRGECNPQAVNVPIEITIFSFTGTSLTIVVANQKRTYDRAPDADHDKDHGELPAAQLR